MFFSVSTSSASTITGKIIDADSANLSFATVYVKNTTYGVSADYNGNYFIELKPGNYTLIYSYLGYTTIEKEIVLKANENLTVNVQMLKSDVQITEIEIVSNRKNKAKRIMSNVRDNRRDYLTNVNNFECESYVKTSIENEYQKEIVDSTQNAKDFETYLAKENLNLIEYVAQTYFKRPNKYKENILAYHNYTQKRPLRGGQTVGIYYGENDIAPQQYFVEDPYVFYRNSTSGDFNFYKNLMDFPVLCEHPLVSPIASNSALYYKFVFVSSFYENDIKINKISVTPINKVSALFYGNIYIEDSTWALVSVDLSINEKALSLYQNFNIIQNYDKINDSIYLPVRTDITYTIKDGKGKILGNTKIIRQKYAVNQNIDPKIFNNEVLVYEDDAFDKDSTYWDINRLVTLKNKELVFIDKSDSIQEYYVSDEYLDKQDSIYNRITWWTPFAGIGYSNHYAGIKVHFGGLLEQVNPFGIGGYRHALPLMLNKYFENGMLFETDLKIDYGFRNKDFKGKFGIGFTYFPKKFIRTYIEIADYYDIVNNYASVEQVFSRSNYVRNKTFVIKQRMEIINGLFAELSFTYSNQFPIDDIQLSHWSDSIFGELNEPIDFEQYTKSEFKLELIYRIGQKFVIKNNRKIIIGNDLPEISLTYRKGIPNLFNSEVNFDYLELGSKGIFNLARMGESRWQVKAGFFLNKTDLRLLEYKYFRGSDMYFFSDPTASMQLLGSTLNTNNEFIQANYIHHFAGSILNKVPLFKYLKLSLAGGVGTLNIPKQNFYHFEMLAGVEKAFRIKKELLRFGVYAVTADNTIADADIRIKFGISFFNSYDNKWGY